MTSERKTEIHARLEAATPGPWVDMTTPEPDGGTFAGEVWGDMARDRIVRVCRDPDGDDRPQDRALIANAPQDLADLLAEVERLEDTRRRELETCLRYAKSLQDPDMGMWAEIADEFVAWLGSRLSIVAEVAP